MKNKPVSNLCLSRAAMLDLVILPDKKFHYELPRYQRPADLDLSKQWLIRFNVWSEEKHKLVLKRVRVTGDTITQRDMDAKRLIKEITEVLEAGAFVDPLPEGAVLQNGKKKISLVVAMTEFMDDKKLTLKKNSVSTYEKWERYFLEFLVAKKYDEHMLDEFESSHATEMRVYALKTQKMGNKTFNSYKGFVSGIFNYHQPVYKVDNPITRTIKKLKEQTSKHVAYNNQQVKDYKAACEKLDLPELWFFVRMIYYLLCRPHEELRRMQIGDIKATQIFIYAEASKTGHRSVMIPSALEEVFKEWKIRDLPPHWYIFSHGGRPGPTMVSKSFMYERHMKVMKVMGLEKSGYDIYGWKHTGTIALYIATKDLMLVKEQCGHSDISQTVQYLRDLGVFHYSNQIHKFPAI